MVEGIQRLSRIMEIRTIAEHVGDQAMLTLLKETGVDLRRLSFGEGQRLV